MHRKKLLTISGTVLTPLLLAACLSSGSSNGNGNGNGNGGNTSGGGTPLAAFPSVEQAEALDLDGNYDGNTDWADISSDVTAATFTTTDQNAPRDAQVAVDTAYMLWHTAHTAHSRIHGTVFWLVEYGALAERAGLTIDDIDEDGELDDLPWDQGFGLGEKCDGDAGDWDYQFTDGYQAGEGEFNDVCVKNYSTTDGGPMTISGEFEWSEASSGFASIGDIDGDSIPSMVPPEQTVTFSDVTVKWRGETFTMNGKNRAGDHTEPPSNARAVELTHVGSGQTFKLLSELAGDDGNPRHTYQFFHPELGKFWGLPNQSLVRSAENPFDWVNSTGLLGGGSGTENCTDEAEFGDLTIREDGSGADMVVELAECDRYNLSGQASDGQGVEGGPHDLDINQLLE